MKIMNCPLNGPRNIQEFVHGGELVSEPDVNACSDAEWTDFVFMEENSAGVVREWWCHVATAYWFIAERDTVKDEIIRTFDPRELFKERVEFTAPAEPAPPPSPEPVPPEPAAAPEPAPEPEASAPEAPDAAEAQAPEPEKPADHASPEEKP